MRLAETTGDQEVMGQRGFVFFASSPVTGKTCLVCLRDPDLYGGVLPEATVCAEIEG